MADAYDLARTGGGLVTVGIMPTRPATGYGYIEKGAHAPPGFHVAQFVEKPSRERASRAIGIPVTGLDLIVPDPSGDEYVFIEANERPGLANHEPQPTAERFIDLLFPTTSALPRNYHQQQAHEAGTGTEPRS